MMMMPWNSDSGSDLVLGFGSVGIDAGCEGEN